MKKVLYIGNYKDGTRDGLWTEWHENGQKSAEGNYKDGKLWTAVAWRLNGEKCPETNVVNGNGDWVWYKEDGTESWRRTYKDGEVDLVFVDGKLLPKLIPTGPSLKLSVAVQFLNGEVRPAGDVEFFVLRENLETVVKKAGINLPVEQGISSAAELWARSIQSRDRYPVVAAQIRNALAGSNLARIKTDASGSASVGFLFPGTYYVIGSAPLGAVGVVWSKSFKILSSTKTNNLKLDLRDATWAQ